MKRLVTKNPCFPLIISLALGLLTTATATPSDVIAPFAVRQLPYASDDPAAPQRLSIERLPKHHNFDRGALLVLYASSHPLVGVGWAIIVETLATSLIAVVQSLPKGIPLSSLRAGPMPERIRIGKVLGVVLLSQESDRRRVRINLGDGDLVQIGDNYDVLGAAVSDATATGRSLGRPVVGRLRVIATEPLFASAYIEYGSAPVGSFVRFTGRDKRNAQAQALDSTICKGGRIPSSDGVHCCWPGQTWVSSNDTCVGIPATCPNGTRVAGEECILNAPCPTGMAYIPPGIFQILDTQEKVSIKGYCIDILEVTTDEYKRCIEQRNCSLPAMGSADPHCNFLHTDRGRHPINCVNSDQATSYCSAHGKRLPTDAEWEWAARGAGATIRFPWGESYPTKEHLCWEQSQGPNTCQVGSFPAGVSKQGVYDLSGNVFEWTIYREGVFVARGGSWDIGGGRVERCRIAYRKESPGQGWGMSIGFRCAQNSR